MKKAQASLSLLVFLLASFAFIGIFISLEGKIFSNEKLALEKIQKSTRAELECIKAKTKDVKLGNWDLPKQICGGN